MKLPFGWPPGHWGLKGKTRELAKAEYELEGETLERKLIEINIEDEEELTLRLLKLDRKHKKIGKEAYDYKYVELKFTEGLQRTLANLELDKKYGKISETEYEKASFSLNGQPWVGVVASEFNPEKGTSGFSFELDWNDAFVQMCKKGGYGFEGATEEQIVEQWFEDVATEEYYQEIKKGEEEYFEGEVYAPEPTVPKTTTVHERIDKTKSRHS